MEQTFALAFLVLISIVVGQYCISRLIEYNIEAEFNAKGNRGTKIVCIIMLILCSILLITSFLLLGFTLFSIPIN